MNELDVLTLQLLSSKKRYNKYLEQAQPDKSKEIQEYHGKIRKHHSKIIEMIETYLEKPNTQTTTEVDEIIEACFKTIIKHYEMLNREHKAFLKDYDETDSSDDEGEVEGEAGEDEGEVEVEDDDDLNKNKKSPNSLWGGNIAKTSGSNLDAFIFRKKKE
jgi:hypothetical protein